MMEYDEADPFVEERKEFPFLGVVQFALEIVKQHDVVIEYIVAIPSLGGVFLGGRSVGNCWIVAKELKKRFRLEAMSPGDDQHLHLLGRISRPVRGRRNSRRSLPAKQQH